MYSIDGVLEALTAPDRSDRKSLLIVHQVFSRAGYLVVDSVWVIGVHEEAGAGVDVVHEVL